GRRGRARAPSPRARTCSRESWDGSRIDRWTRCRLPWVRRDAGTVRSHFTGPLRNASARLRALVRLERCEPAVAPAHALGDRLGTEPLPLAQDAVEVLALVDRGIGGAEPAQTGAVAPAIVGDAARGVELDRLERTHERPAQAEPVLERLVEVLRRHVALAGEA